MENIKCDNCNYIAYTRWQFTGKYELLKGECFIHANRTNTIQPERLSEKTVDDGSDSLNSMET